MNKKLISFFISLLFLTGNILNAQDTANDKETVLATTILPSPGEVLNSLGKIGRVQWSSLVDYNKYYNYKGRNRQALNLGVRVADAFVALQDKDKNNFGEMNAVIYSLSKELGISNIIETQKDKLQQMSSKDDWVLLVIELNEMNGSLQEALVKQKDDDIVLLSGVAGFLEGIRIVSSHFKDNYNAEKVEMLKQIKLVEYYIDAINQYSKLKDDPSVESVEKSLQEIKALLVADPSISLKTVKQLETISSNAIKSISK